MTFVQQSLCLIIIIHAEQCCCFGHSLSEIQFRYTQSLGRNISDTILIAWPSTVHQTSKGIVSSESLPQPAPTTPFCPRLNVINSKSWESCWHTQQSHSEFVSMFVLFLGQKRGQLINKCSIASQSSSPSQSLAVCVCTICSTSKHLHIPKTI